LTKSPKVETVIPCRRTHESPVFQDMYLCCVCHFLVHMLQICLFCDSRPVFATFFQIRIPFALHGGLDVTIISNAPAPVTNPLFWELGSKAVKLQREIIQKRLKKEPRSTKKWRQKKCTRGGPKAGGLVHLFSLQNTTIWGRIMGHKAIKVTKK
jgi:hypothetical protein